jgi:hypothetical protein
MPGPQKNGKNNAVTTETLIKAPTMKSRQRPFCIISPLQLLHFIPETTLYFTDIGEQPEGRSNA